VSLLLDALKRAEQEKLARGDRPEAESGTARATPAAASAPPAPAGLELQPIAPAAANSAAGPKPAGSPQAAQVVFQAKAAPAANEPRSRSMLLGTAIGGLLIVVIAVGAYVWHTIRTLTPQPVAAVRPLPPGPLANVAPAPAAAEPAPPFVPREPGATRMPSTSAPGTTPPSGASPAPPASVPAPGAPPAAAPPPRAAATLSVTEPARGDAASAMQEVLRSAAAPPLRMERSNEAPRVPRDISAGYEALTRGDLAAARKSYQAALASDAAGVDALLGMATVEAQSGNRSAAAALYRRALEVDARNATAHAGLAALADYSRPEALEAQLRDDLTRQPDSAQLRFALGNLFASQSRWTEAQAEFFEAYRLDPGVADVLYNLAVSLDHLGQPKLAVEFYARALEAAQVQATQFDPAPVARRLAELRR
jgi:Tfp pilus assembly protein PilF